MKESFSALVADPSPAVRVMIRNVLAELGIEQCDIAASLADVRKRLRERRFDIVLCEYNFAGEDTGQDLLEEMRANGVLPPSTLFFIVTSESNYGTVVSVAEESPDDYLVKPLQTAELSNRIERGFAKRRELLDIYRAIEANQLDSAISIAKQQMQVKSRFTQDVVRLSTQLLFRLGRYEEAARILHTLLAHKSLPWAKLVLARVAIRQGDNETAENALRELISAHPLYLPVYNQLVDICRSQERYSDALDVTERAITISPNSVKRLQQAGQLACSLGDDEKGNAYLARAVKVSGKALDLDAHSLYLLVISSQHGGDAAQAQSLIRQMQIKAGNMNEDSISRARLDWFVALAEAVLALDRREPLAAVDKLKRIAESWSKTGFDLPLALDLFKALDRLYAEDIAATLAGWIEPIALRMCAGRAAQDLLENAVSARKRLADVVTAAAEQISATASEAARLMVNNQYDQATQKLYEAGVKTRNNRLLVAAANAAAKCLQQFNDKKYAAIARDCVLQVDPPDEELLARLKWVIDKA